MSASIKNLDENTYRNLKAEAVRHGMTISEAANEAINHWIAKKRLTPQRDTERMQEAARQMDALRARNLSEWSGVETVRRWRDINSHC